MFFQDKTVKRNAFGDDEHAHAPDASAWIGAFCLSHPATSMRPPTTPSKQFYKGKTITVGRAIRARRRLCHLQPDHGASSGEVSFPAIRQIVPQYRPGAGGIVASNYVYNLAPRDGSVMAMVSDSVALASVIDADKAKYKVNEFIWLGAIERVNNVLAVRADTGVTRIPGPPGETKSRSADRAPARRRPCCRRLLRWLRAGEDQDDRRLSTASIRCSLRSSATRFPGSTVSWTIFKTLRKRLVRTRASSCRSSSSAA